MVTTRAAKRRQLAASAAGGAPLLDLNDDLALHLLARQRVAEARLPDDVDDHAGFFENSLVRSLTDTRVISAVAVSADLARSQSGAQAALSQKQDELDQVTEELRLNPVTVDIPPPKKRTCAQCAAEFAFFEGGQCLEMRKSHFLCNICFGGYLMKACAVGGSYEQEIRSPDGVFVVLDNDDGVAEIAQMKKRFKQSPVVALMQSN